MSEPDEDPLTTELLDEVERLRGLLREARLRGHFPGEIIGNQSLIDRIDAALAGEKHE